MLAMPVFLAFELSVIIVVLGFLLYTQSNSTVIGFIAVIIIIVGLVCVALCISEGMQFREKKSGIEEISSTEFKIDNATVQKIKSEFHSTIDHLHCSSPFPLG